MRTKRLLSLVVAVAMMLTMIPSFNIASAATTVDPFEALKNRSIYAVASNNGYIESNLSIRDTGRTLAGKAHSQIDLFDISEIPYDSDSNTISDCAQLQGIIAKIQAGVPTRTEEDIKKNSYLCKNEWQTVYHK